LLAEALGFIVGNESMKHLGIAIGLFVALDLAAFSIGFTISREVGKSAVAINLAGRQRMLSQRITKAALVARDASVRTATRELARQEVDDAYALFQVTLHAFAEGGTTLGGAGVPVHLEPVPRAASGLIATIRESVKPWPVAPPLGPEMDRFAAFMVERNLEILEAMNHLTTELENQSVAAVFKLQVAQLVTFSLSLINFFSILLGVQRARKRVEIELVTDHLTGLLNRAGIYRTLDAALIAETPSSMASGVMLFDLDNFKAINDSYGHAEGDKVLVEVARRINSWKLPGWSCGRLGGDEFVMILPETNREHLDKLARDLEMLLSGIPAGGIVASASVGWAISESADSTADMLISAADTMMYVHKAERRTFRHLRSAPRAGGTVADGAASDFA
jgi:diguanylate cyclase (GGDEF)-like protein